jgi:hypothetical protein
VIGALAAHLDRELSDLQLEVVDELEARVDGAPPRIRNRHPVEQLAAGQPEQVRDRAGVPEGHQRRVDAVLQRRAMPNEMQAVARKLALAPDRWVGQPDRRDQVAMREDGQDLRVDAVGLAGQRREALDLLRVGDEDFPAELFERVVHEPRPGHRLDHRPDALTAQLVDEVAQPVGVRRRRRPGDDVAGIVDHADVEPCST